MAKLTMDKLVALCKNRGYIFAGSEIYGGLANTWDFGPLGVEFKNNIKRAWWQKFVQETPYNTGLDCAILMNREVWVASGHVGGFNDPLMDCKACKARFRADKLIEDYTKGAETGDGWTNAELENYIAEHDIVCPVCGKKDFTGIRQFNLMFKTHAGRYRGYHERTLSPPRNRAGHLREFPEYDAYHAQKAAVRASARSANPSATKSRPATSSSACANSNRWSLNSSASPAKTSNGSNIGARSAKNWLLSLGMKEEHLRLRDHEKDKLAFYSKATTDFEYLFPFGWGELWGVADRTDYDLKQHSEHSGKALEYLDPTTNEKFIPYCVEPSVGVERLVLSFLCDAYDEEELEGGDVRTVLHLHPALAPYKVAVMPLQKNKLGDQARALYAKLSKHFMCDYDETGSIGKRYRRQDEIGTPYCICVDFDTESTGNVTVRDRDTMQQEAVAIADLENWLREKIDF